MTKAKLLKDASADVTIKGKNYTVKYDMAAFLELEEIYGDIEGIFKALTTGKLKDIFNLFWAGILHAHPTITVKDIAKDLDITEIEKIAFAVRDIFTNSLPDSDVKVEGGNASAPSKK